MKQLITTLVFLFVLQISFAQYTGVINSKRPGASDSPFGVGTKVYQVEAGLFYKNVGNYLYHNQSVDPTDTYSYSATAMGTDITLRTGAYFEKLEINLDFAALHESRDYTQPTTYSESGLGLGKLTIGAKYLIYKPEYTDKTKEIKSWKARQKWDRRRLIPAVGVYAGLNTNFLHEMYKNPDGMSPRLAVFSQNNLSNQWVVLVNLIMDKAFTTQSENSFIVTSTYALTPEWSAFGEVQGFFRKDIPNDFQFGAGGAYLINNNFQADLSGRIIFDERGDNSFIIGAGVSWRLNRHRDKVIKDKTKDENVIVAEKKKKSFLEIISFGYLGGRKSPTDVKMQELKEIKAKPRSLEPPVNKKAVKARAKRKKELIKERKKAKEKIVKEKEKIEKEAQKEKDRELKSLEKEQYKLEKGNKKSKKEKKKDDDEW